MPKPSDLLQGTLDLLILKTIAREPLHGWGIAKRLLALSGDVLSVGQGSLYPALHRLEQQGWIRAEWRDSELGRSAKFYALTREGQEAARARASELGPAVLGGAAGDPERLNMRHLRLLRHRLRSLFRRRLVDEELERELSLHFEALVRENIEAGMDEGAARLAARRAFGPPDLASEQCRDARRVRWLEDLARDVRHALRLLGRSPGFTLTAVLSLALGIGANTAIFSVVDAVLLRRLPVERPHELVLLESVRPGGRGGAPPYPFLERLRSQTQTLDGLAAFATDELRVEVAGALEQVFGQVASGSYFELLGLRPALGRLLTRDDERLDPPVAVIGHGYWQRRFAGSPAAIGQTIASGDRAYTIVGVTPPGFWGLQPGRQVEVTLPITTARRLVADPDAWWSEAIARLRPGVSVQQAVAEADGIYQAFLRDRGQSGELRRRHADRLQLAPAARGMDRLRARFSQPLYALTAVAAIVLLIACANLASLLLARGAARERELAIRLATGAGTGRLFRQLLTETLVLFVLGAAAGLLVAQVAIRGLTGFFAVGRNPILLDVDYDWRLAAFAAGVALAAGVLTGLWPALRGLRTDPQAAMKAGESRLGGSRRSGAMARALVTSQVALSLVLLPTAVMFVTTLANLRSVEPGFRSSGILTMSLDSMLPGGVPPGTRQQLWTRMLERVRALPGVGAASLSVLTPLSGRSTDSRVSASGFEPRHEGDRTVHLNHVSEDYFRAFAIPLRTGRTFTRNDAGAALKVAVLNEAAANAYFAGRSPLGQTLSFGPGSTYRVVGVVGNHKHRSLREPAPRFAFIPLWQPVDPIGRVTLAVSAEGAPADLARTVPQEIRTIHPRTLVSDLVRVEEQIDATLVSERLLSALAGVFALLALALAAIGLYGVLSHSIARRRGELAVRIALGGPPARVASAVLGELLLQVAAGVAIGLVLALATAQAARGLLFGVTPGDPANYLLGLAAFALVAGLAAWLPARRVRSIDPGEALRCA